MAITYPRHCQQCNYTARSQQAWSQHIKSMKHIQNCGICQPKELSVSTPVSNQIDSFLAIIADLNNTIKLQAETIKSQSDIINRGFRGDVSGVMMVPQPSSVTLNISDLVTPKQYSNNIVKPKQQQQEQQQPQQEQQQQPQEQSPDNALNIDDLLEPDFYIGSTTEPEEFEAQILRRFMDGGKSMRPIRFHKGLWEYKQNDIWHSDNCEHNVNLIIKERLRQQYREIDDMIGERNPTQLQDKQMVVLSSMMGDNTFQLWKPHGLTQNNCKF